MNAQVCEVLVTIDSDVNPVFIQELGLIEATPLLLA